MHARHILSLNLPVDACGFVLALDAWSTIVDYDVSFSVDKTNCSSLSKPLYKVLIYNLPV